MLTAVSVVARGSSPTVKEGFVTRVNRRDCRLGRYRSRKPSLTVGLLPLIPTFCAKRSIRIRSEKTQNDESKIHPRCSVAVI